MKKQSIFWVLIIILSTACTTNPITGRKQANIVSEAELQKMAQEQYMQFLAQNKSNIISSKNATYAKDYQAVITVGKKIAHAITQYYTEQGLGKEVANYKWEFNLIKGDDANAFCMPGGKVVVYTGLLPVAKNEDGLAVVLGHEIAHAVLKHGQERMSRSLGAQTVGQLASILIGTQSQQVASIFENIYAPVATTTAILPNSRAQESEADRFGLRFAAMAGYNPKEAIPFWKRMAQMGGDATTPTILRTHPTTKDRIANIEKILPEVLPFYQKTMAAKK